MIFIRYDNIPTRIAVLTFYCSIFSYLLPKHLIFDIITVTIYYNTFLHNIFLGKNGFQFMDGDYR